MATVHHSWCRSFGHAWDPSDVDKDPAGYEVTLRCSRCDTRRLFRLTRRGERDGYSRYRYQPGYLVKGGVDRELARLQALGLRRR